MSCGTIAAGKVDAVPVAGRAATQSSVLDGPDALCLARLRKRNAGGEHSNVVGAADFAESTSYFEPPTGSGAFETIIYR